MNAELEKLVALQKSDTGIKTLKNAIQTVDQRRDAIEQEFEARAFQIREIQKNRNDASAEKTQFESSIADLNSSLERTERNLKASQNPKQYEAAVREKSVLEKQISDLETQVLEKTEALESAEKVLTERAAEIASIESERTEKLLAFETEVETQKEELEKMQKRREKAFVTLPKNLAATYDRLVKRIRDGVAVAEVKNGACGSCQMRLRPQMLVDIKVSGQILTCESCTRILYIQPAETATV